MNEMASSGSTTPITIRRGRDLPASKRCTSCCSLYHCPFCLTSFFKPTKEGKLLTHLQLHFSRAVVHEDYTIHRCGLGWKAKLHYHCVYCATTILRHDNFVGHLKVCKMRKPPLAVSMPTTAPDVPPLSARMSTIVPDVPPSLAASTSSVPPRPRRRTIVRTQCPHCHITVQKKNLRKHLERKHAKRHVFQTHHQLFRTVQSPDLTSRAHDGADDGGPPYPLTEELESMIRYVLNNKTIPATLPDHLRLPSFSHIYPCSLIPEEITCQRCVGYVPLSDPLLITSKAKILTNTRIIHDVATYSRRCHQCGIHYRYQEWKDGLHNFNDSVILDLSLCLHLRNMLQVHTAVGRVVECLELTIGEPFPPATTVLQAYLHFEALTNHEYEYSCVTCGDHPPIVIMALHRNGPFNMSLSDIKPPPEDFNGEVDMDAFWEKLTLQMIGRGFVTRQSDNPFNVHPSYHLWAPWIGRNTRRSSQCLNTEFQKIHLPKKAEFCKITVSEERLKNELLKQKVSVIRKLCKECGVNSIGSKYELLERLSSKMKSRQTYEKVFEKIRGVSGGWAVVMCPCGVVYSTKCCLRAESPRDFADVLLSLKHIPNIVICNFARDLATHTNLRSPERLTFTPHEGQLADPTKEIINMAKEGKLKVVLPWLDVKKEVPDTHGHPITGSAEHYCLGDKFHEDNSKDEPDALRRLDLVVQIGGKVKSQVETQLMSKLRKNNYFLNKMLPSTQLFLMRSIVHHHNSQKNIRRGKTFKTVSWGGVVMNISHQAVTGTSEPKETSGLSVATGVQVISTEAREILVLDSLFSNHEAEFGDVQYCTV